MSAVLDEAAKALLAPAMKGQEGEGEKEEGEGEGEGEGTSIEQGTDSGKDSQATVTTPHSDVTNMEDTKAITRTGGHKPQSGENDLCFDFGGLGADEGQRGYFDNFDNEGEESEEEWEEESVDPPLFLSPFMFTGKKGAGGAFDEKELKDDSHSELHHSSDVEAAYLALYAHMESVSSAAIFTPACQDVTFGDEEVPIEDDTEEGDEIEETGEGIVQWIDVGDGVELDEGEQSDSSGEGTPTDAVLAQLDLEKLSVRLSSRSEEDRTHSRNYQSIPDEILLFKPRKDAISPRSALNKDDMDDGNDNVDKDDKDDVSMEVSSERPCKRAWVPKTVDFALVVQDLSVALTAQELRTIKWKEKLQQTSRKVAEAEMLKRCLQESLGVEAFNDATNFLRTVATMQIEDSNAEDDEYLLSQMEEIVGAEGLQCMEDIFALITIEDDIEREQIDAKAMLVK